MKRLFICSTLALGCTLTRTSSPTKGVTFPFESSRWTSKTIQVCFEPTSDDVPLYKQAMQKILENEYNGRTEWSFIGFQTCGINENIRVNFKNKVGPFQVQQFGAYLNNLKDGVLLFSGSESGPEKWRYLKRMFFMNLVMC